MTAILGAGNRDVCVLVSDRRMTAGATLVDDASNKAALLVVSDAHVAVAFTGLGATHPEALQRHAPAKPNEFLTSQWMLEALAAAAPPEHEIDPLIDRFATAATERFRRLFVQAADKRTEFVFVGFVERDGRALPSSWTVTNIPHDEPLPQPTFTVQRDIDQCFAIAAGKVSAIDPALQNRLFAATCEQRPADALVSLAVHAIERAAEHSPAVGPDSTSIMVPARPSATCVSRYHSSTVSHVIHGVSHVDARGGEHLTVLTMTPEHEVHAADGTPFPLTVPRVGRNVPCPCGSGRKFKRCHGRR